ncbi:hypothetical protein F383_27212 [Gossypium arboreum]|uniref:Uncharacterized protein n=1 Tax=Gossypium arboreum TaxID=29729 RepID=A0A0B0PC05_GOSAR|nr:hypothetical protein F383_27212 [Gossypium arboreum]
MIKSTQRIRKFK